ncbi:MAG: efflux transporter outer membrane subunit [Desulfovermiculus sp.]|nr:efflux transporter outer membrane subunit [Desulfovermiculus sp.]
MLMKAIAQVHRFCFPAVLKAAFSILSLALLSGCMAFAPPQRSAQPVEFPTAFAWNMNGTAPVEAWWEAFNSRELNRLVDTALDDNFDIRASWARLRQAQAVAAKSRAGLFPVVDTGLEGSRTRTYRDNDLLSDNKSASLDLAASFELDLWGRIRSGYTADQLSARSAHEDVRAAVISLTGEVVGTWVDLLASRQEMQVVKEQVQINEQLLRLQATRFENGMATALDVTQQQELVANSRSALPPLQARERVALNKLALLLGQADMQTVSIQEQSLPQPVSQPETGIPAELLMSRPDVRAAYYRLLSADWEVSVARADRLPSLSISARTAMSSDSFRLAWGDWLTRLGTNLSAPLFDAGARKAEVERTQAVVDERLADYSAAVLEAIKEVQDALANISGQENRIAELKDELRAAKQARSQARLRYLKGQSDYLNFITQQRSVQGLQRNLITARTDLLSSQIALYRALGGGGGNGKNRFAP